MAEGKGQERLRRLTCRDRKNHGQRRQAAILEAVRLDDQEAPQREAARVTKANDAERTRLEQARLGNKPKFRP